jgi:hypothetical protein
MGPYCRFCDHRCFVERKLPADAKWMPGESVILATCDLGSAHDRMVIGYDYSTATNLRAGDAR